MKRLLLIGGLALAIAAPLSTVSAYQMESQKKAWLGVSIQDVTKSLMNDENLKDRDGAYVADVVDDSPADSAGIRKGDVIRSFNGRTIYDADDLSKAVSRVEPGTKATVVLMRNGESKNLTVVLRKQPRRRGYAAFFGQAPRVAVFHGGKMLGLSLMSLNKQLAEYFGAPNKEGVLVQEVEEGSSAEKAGVKAGDVLLRIGTRSIDDMSDVTRALDKYDAGEKAEIEVLRKGSKKTMTVEIEEGPDSPWGLVAPAIPDMELYAPHIERFDFDVDRFNNDFRFRVEPKLRELEFKMQSLAPRIRIQEKDLQRKLRENIFHLRTVREL